MGVSACVRVSYLKRGSGYFIVQTKHFHSAKRAKFKSDLSPNTSDFSRNANSVERRRSIVQKKQSKVIIIIVFFFG